MTTLHGQVRYRRHEQTEPEGERPLVQRYPDNPIIAPEDVPGGAVCAFNSGVTMHGAKYVMLLNAWDLQWRPRFLVARSDDGAAFRIDARNMVEPPHEHPYVPHEGIFDTRITTMGDVHYITWNVASRLGGRVMLGRTTDFEVIDALGYITAPDHRNCVLFPRRVNGDYVRLERPNVDDGGDIYVSYSPDLIHWGRSQLVLERNRRYWQSAKVGPGAPPVLTEQGWLVVYHGCRRSMNGFTYQAGAMLLDAADPTRVIGLLDECLMAPQLPYEQSGLVPNVVFPTAALLDADGDTLRIYYGAADTCMCLATTSLGNLLDRMVSP